MKTCFLTRERSCSLKFCEKGLRTMAILWFVIGVLVGIGIMIGAFMMFTVGMNAGKKEAGKAEPIKPERGEVE